MGFSNTRSTKFKPAARQIRIAIASNAGGSGKTTMAIHLAYGLGARGYRTTLIELDANGSLCTFAGLQPVSVERSFAAILKKDFKGDYPLVPLWAEYLSTVTAIQGGTPLEESIHEIYRSTRKYQLLQDCLEDYPIASDVLLFDTPASLEPMGLLALAACTHILAPIKPEYKDTGSLADLLNWYYEKVRELRLKPQPQILGFAPSRIAMDKAVHRNILGIAKKGEKVKVKEEDTLPYQIQQLGVQCFPPIRECDYYLWASGVGLPLNLYRPGCTFSQDFDPIVEHVIHLITS
ncbi:MAG: ParA family protein [Leptolyngbyaceae cyanobacterium bins.59]|nr:ParA family protein [Leptolyngbyaceae cyanobacterium bins.59]